MTSHHIVIVDDHPLFRDALNQSLHSTLQDVVTREAGSLNELNDRLHDSRECDLILLDLNMPGVSGFSALAYIRNNHESLPTVIVSAMDDPAVIRRSIQHGASGFIPKSSTISTLEDGIKAVLDGEVWLPKGVDLQDNRLDRDVASIAETVSTLTPHQFRVLMMLGEGLLNKQIAYQLGVSEATIKAHVTAILRKMHVNNRTQAVLAVQQLKIDSPSTLKRDSGDLTPA